MVMVEVDNKVPPYLQNQGAPFYYVAETQDFPRSGTSADFMAWLDRTSGQHWAPQRTQILVQQRENEPLILGYLGKDHQLVRTLPSNGERRAKRTAEGSVAFIPQALGD